MLFGGGIHGVSLLTRRPELLRGKRLAVFTVGIADPENPDNAKKLARDAEKALGPLAGQAAVFHLRGALDYAKLGWKHRTMMAGLRAMLRKKDPAELRPEDRQLLGTYGGSVDFTDRAALAPLVAFARGE